MPVSQKWEDKNRPENDPDYQRIVEAVGVIEEEIKISGSVNLMNRRFDYDTGLRFGVRRTEETRQITCAEEDEKSAVVRLCNAWVEGFAFGSLIYSRYGRGRTAETFADQMALVDVNHLLKNSDQEKINGIYAGIVSGEAVSFVGTLRSANAYISLKPLVTPGSRSRIRELLAAHWFDAFSVGLVFQELGGHRT